MTIKQFLEKYKINPEANRLTLLAQVLWMNRIPETELGQIKTTKELRYYLRHFFEAGKENITKYFDQIIKDAESLEMPKKTKKK